MNYKELAEQALDYIVEQRRWCHQNPELSLEEVQTTEHIAAELQKMGYTEIQRFPDHTGLCAMLRGGKAEKACRTVALRADIDALPVEEKTGLPFASRNKGVMHACGHDCHISMLLGAAKMLMETKDELQGNVKLIFQAAEETCHGAEYMLKRVSLMAWMPLWASTCGRHWRSHTSMCRRGPAWPVWITL